MTIRFAHALCAGMLAFSTSAAAQNPLDLVAQTTHRCTFDRACNWSSHAAIAFGITSALDHLDVPRELAAGAAALLYIGKELRDHARWRVLGTEDSNGDLVSGILGALIAYQLQGMSLSESFDGILIEPGDAWAFGVRLRFPQRQEVRERADRGLRFTAP